MVLYRVTTTFPCADGHSRFYFDTEEKAQKFRKDECSNGEVNIVIVTGDAHYFDGCTWNDLSMGGDIDLSEAEI